MKGKTSVLELVKKKGVVSKETVYKYVNKFEDELKSAGIIEVAKKGTAKRIFVIDTNKFIEFFKEKDIHLFD